MSEFDEISSLLEEDDDDTVTYFPESEDKKEEVTAPVKQDNSELEDLRRQFLEQQAELNRMKSFPVSERSAPQAPISTRDDLKRQIEHAYLSDPAEAMLSIYELAKKEAIIEAERKFFPVAGQTTRFAIDQYKRSSELLTDEQEEFEHLVSQIDPKYMAQVDPSQLPGYLQTLKHAAMGAALEKRKKKPQPHVPVYSAGSGIPQSSAPVQVKLTKGQKDYYQVGLDNGLAPKQILQLIKDHGIQ